MSVNRNVGWEIEAMITTEGHCYVASNSNAEINNFKQKIENSSDGEKEKPCNLGQDSVFWIKT